MARSTSGRSPPGSITTARFVTSHHSKVQFCWKGVTGTITALVLVMGTPMALRDEAEICSRPRAYRSSSTFRARLSGFVDGAKRARTMPALSIKNFVKFHFILSPSNPRFCFLSQT
jgi:hypothetical protein